MAEEKSFRGLYVVRSILDNMPIFPIGLRRGGDLSDRGWSYAQHTTSNPPQDLDQMGDSVHSQHKRFGLFQSRRVYLQLIPRICLPNPIGEQNSLHQSKAPVKHVVPPQCATTRPAHFTHILVFFADAFIQSGHSLTNSQNNG